MSGYPPSLRYHFQAYQAHSQTRKLLAFALAVVPIAGCTAGGVFNYSAPIYSGSLDTAKQIAIAASTSATLYQHRANDNANGVQVFEVPAIGAGIGAVAGSVFGATLREIQGFALGGASMLAFDQYYSPKQRAKIYMNGSQAMSCLATLAYETSHVLYDGTDDSVQTRQPSKGLTRLYNLFTASLTLPEGPTTWFTISH
jgi:hypothetical protein